MLEEVGGLNKRANDPHHLKYCQLSFWDKFGNHRSRSAGSDKKEELISPKKMQDLTHIQPEGKNT